MKNLIVEFKVRLTENLAKIRNRNLIAVLKNWDLEYWEFQLIRFLKLFVIIVSLPIVVWLQKWWIDLIWQFLVNVMDFIHYGLYLG